MKHLNAIEKMENTCIAVGHFEGVHKGHLAVAAKLAEVAKERGLTSVIVSLYDPAAPTLSTEAEKEYLLKDSGVDVLISVEENAVPADLAAQLGAKVVVACQCCAENPYVKGSGCEVITVPGAKDGDTPITTALLREVLQSTDMLRYEALAGHPYLMIGPIVHGAAKGRTVGQPTANQGVPENKIKPVDGVYATISYIDDQVWMGMTNIGKRPSVDNFNYVTIETNLLDFSGDVYDKIEVMEVYDFVRGVMKFENLEKVMEQVGRDKARIRTRLAEIAASHNIKIHLN